LSWSPDGKFLALSGRSSPGDPSGIYSLSIDTGEETRLTTPTGELGDYSAAFSPDGRNLAFTRFEDSSLVGDIYLAALDGGELTQLTFDGQWIRGLAWTPDGSEIVFSSTREGARSLWKVSASGGVPERLAGGGDGSWYPTIARQGQRLAFVQRGRDLNIWRAETEQSSGAKKPAVKLAASTRNDLDPQISADGRKIAFASVRSGYREIWVCDSDGSNPIQLTSFAGPPLGSPRWSPNGGQIAFDSTAKGNWDIYVINSEGGAPRALTSESSEETRPSWSRDGRWIYFHSSRTGVFQIWKAPAEGGQAVQVTKNGGHNPYESPDGRFIYYARLDAELGLYRMPVQGGEEALVLEDLAHGWGCWAVTDKGVYFTDLGGDSQGGWPVKLLEVETGRVAEVLRLEKEPQRGTTCLTVSLDDRWLVYTQDDEGQDDIILVENFR
jgi:Tol biopolymer transport system component